MAKRIIHVLANDGSPLGVTEESIDGRDGRLGCGGAELALLTMCRGWQMYGDDVTLYNNPNKGGASCFKQKTIGEFDPKEDRDILIVFRSPNERINDAKGKRIWWSCDQHTVGDFKQFSSCVNKIITISPFHTNYFKTMYGITNAQHIDLPVRAWEYRDKLPKIKNRCIFTSMPDRGAIPMAAAWARIVGEVPDASIVITSDWRLWVDWAEENATMPFKIAFAHSPNVTYLGAVKRAELIKIQMEAQIHTYTCTYEELFCIAVAESQVAGAMPVTSDCGSLSTTNMGRVIHGSPADPAFIETFVRNVVEFMQDPHLEEKQNDLRSMAIKRFSLENILTQWDEVMA